MESINNPEQDKNYERRPSFYTGFLFFAGVLLPVAALTVEATTQLCAENFFDPMPTWWHTFFIFFVAATNLQTWWAIRQNHLERIVWLGFANAVTIFIALFYTILFTPLLPIAFFGLLAALLGLLPMAPLFSLIAALLMRRDLRRISPAPKSWALNWKGLATGFAIVLFAVGIAEMTFSMTKIGIEMASSDSPEKQAEGLNFIKRFGDQNYLLRLCYNSSGIVTTDYIVNILQKGNVLNFDSPIERDSLLTEKSRKVFYRLNDVDFSRVAAPRGVKSWERNNINRASFDADGQQINEGLLLTGSQMDGSIDGDAALGYLEWTLNFKNEKSWQQEAIAQIQLPQGAVVSRLTLWINGEEREAAFAGRGKVTEAYNSVVSKRKDPVLVTTSGKDRVSMRAFPVPPNGEMKLKIGITAPLRVESETQSGLILPYFQETNFAVATEHAVWFESKKPLEIANQNFTQEQREDFFAVRGKVKNEDLIKLGSPIRVAKSADTKLVWARDNRDSTLIVSQEIKKSAASKPQRVIFVVDASRQMKDFQKNIAATIKNYSFNSETALILTGGNGLNLDRAAPNSFVGNSSEIAEKIEDSTFDGGTDSVAAIEKAWELAQEKPNSAIIWIHAPQTVELAAASNLTQMWTRRAASPPIYSLQTKLGKDTTESILGEAGIIETVPRFGALSDDLKSLLTNINGQNSAFEFVRSIQPAKDFKFSPNAKETSAHLVRLWANDEVKKLLANKTANGDQAALELAVKNQLVTPVSGAVVLETKAQYDQFGLRPVDKNTVPTIPEPEEWLLFGVVLALLIWMFRQFRRPALREI